MKNIYVKYLYKIFYILIIFLLAYFIYKLIVYYFHKHFLDSIEKTIVVIRHGEKNYPDHGTLSCKGLNRSLALPNLLVKRYGNISGIYASKPIFINNDINNDEYFRSIHLRPILTINPLASQLNKTININFNYKTKYGNESLATKLHNNPPGVYIVSWEHYHIPLLVHYIMKNYKQNIDIQNWNNLDFDRIYVIRIFKNGKVSLNVEKEKLNLKLSNLCPN